MTFLAIYAISGLVLFLLSFYIAIGLIITDPEIQDVEEIFFILIVSFFVCLLFGIFWWLVLMVKVIQLSRRWMSRKDKKAPAIEKRNNIKYVKKVKIKGFKCKRCGLTFSESGAIICDPCGAVGCPVCYVSNGWIMGYESMCCPDCYNKTLSAPFFSSTRGV